MDASVALKWVLPDPRLEPDLDHALALLEQIRGGEVAVIQPPHWLVEVGAALTRLRPQIAEKAFALLDAMELEVSTDLALYQRASRLSHELNHHLFDTLYHALALQREGLLITADDRYFRKARKLGSVARLASSTAANLPG